MEKLNTESQLKTLADLLESSRSELRTAKESFKLQSQITNYAPGSTEGLGLSIDLNNMELHKSTMVQSIGDD